MNVSPLWICIVGGLLQACISYLIVRKLPDIHQNFLRARSRRPVKVFVTIGILVLVIVSSLAEPAFGKLTDAQKCAILLGGALVLFNLTIVYADRYLREKG